MCKRSVNSHPDSSFDSSFTALSLWKVLWIHLTLLGGRCMHASQCFSDTNFVPQDCRRFSSRGKARNATKESRNRLTNLDDGQCTGWQVRLDPAEPDHAGTAPTVVCRPWEGFPSIFLATQAAEQMLRNHVCLLYPGHTLHIGRRTNGLKSGSACSFQAAEQLA